MKRFEWIDISKGIGIIFVTLLHTCVFDTGFGAWGSSFHMAIFFALAGLCYDENRYATVAQYIKRKCIALLWPYLTFCILIGGLYYLLCFDGGKAFHNLWRHGFLGGFGYATMWFIWALFYTEVIFGVMALATRNRYARFVLTVLMVVVGYVIKDIRLPFMLKQLANGLFCLGFYWVGLSCRFVLSNEYGRKKISIIGLIAMIFSIGGFVWQPNQYVVASLTVGNPIWFYFMAVCGCVLISAVSMMLDAVKFISPMLQWLGRNSLPVFCLHGACGSCAVTWGGAFCRR